MLVLGIDPGTATTGYGLIEMDGSGCRLRQAGTFRSSAKMTLGARIHALCSQLETLLDEFSPAGVAMEGIFHHRNVRSALTMAHVRGAFLLTLNQRGFEVREYAPTEIKKAVTGYGRAEKSQVRDMVLRLLGHAGELQSLDASDALAVALCHAQVSRFESKVRIGSA